MGGLVQRKRRADAAACCVSLLTMCTVTVRCSLLIGNAQGTVVHEVRRTAGQQGGAAFIRRAQCGVGSYSRA